MTKSFTCARCGATFVAALSPNHHGPMPHTCGACKRKIKRESDRRYQQRAYSSGLVGPATQTKTCRRCGKQFAEPALKPNRPPAHDEGYVEHRYCPSCRDSIQRAARACDRRFTDVGGHVDISEDVP